MPTIPVSQLPDVGQAVMSCTYLTSPLLLLTFFSSLIESSIGLPTFGLIDPTMLLNFLPFSVTIFWVHVNGETIPKYSYW